MEDYDDIAMLSAEEERIAMDQRAEQKEKKESFYRARGLDPKRLKRKPHEDFDYTKPKKSRTKK